ncbi:MAG: hypothetical protein IK151_01730 [Erysipelotrichaceae bacterium]|nr:hypothetical protein [Erysipelotrichaceae bacterium]
MEKIFSVNGLIIDAGDDNKQYTYYFMIDTIANKADIYYLEDKNLYDRLIERLNNKPNYSLTVKSDALEKIVDQLGNVKVDGKKIKGKEAVAVAREGRLDDVLEGILKSLSGKNLFLVLPGLLNSVSDNYKCDIPLSELLKTALSEVGDLDKWRADVIRVNDRNIDSL